MARIPNFKKQIFFFGENPFKAHSLRDVCLRLSSSFKFFLSPALALPEPLGNVIVTCPAVLFPL